ncbi:MAG: tetratricopeptide repeat protein [Magnetococcus sp. THC-1_WYH]
MSWIVWLPIILTASLVVVMGPLLTKHGNRPLPRGVEDDPGLVLENQRVALLGQLKEMEQVGGEGQALAMGRASLEAELAEVYRQLDLGGGRSVQGAVVSSGGDDRVRGVDRGFGAAFAVFAVTASALLYVVMGTTQEIERPSRPPVESAEEMNQLLDKAWSRLQQEPDNLEGWIRLARSFEVMQRIPEALQVYGMILQNHPGNMEARVGLAEMKIQNGASEADIKEGGEMFRAILAENPNNPDALWMLGGLAMRGGAGAEAAGYWQRLLAVLPADDPNREMVQQALDKLKKN